MSVASSPTRLRLDIDRDNVRRCTSEKYGHATRAEALTAAERLMQLGKVNPGCHITPYECDECGQWHVFNRVIVHLPGVNVRASSSSRAVGRI